MAKTLTKDPMESILANIEKQMGNKSSPILSRFGNIKSNASPSISFGIKAVDEASYINGIPRGKMVEIYGPESSGKSLLTLYLIANAQKQGLECALLDVEQSFDPDWAAKHGVNIERLVYANEFECGEQALEYAYQMVKSGAFALVVVDSTAALTPKAELEGTLEDNAKIGAQAQLLSRGCRKIRSSCGTTGTTCVFINQVRMKIGVMYGCFHYNSRVILEDGTSMKIGTIVNNKINANVLSYNPINKIIEPKKIIAWHDNGNLSDSETFLQIVAEKYGGNGRTNISCTPNHIIFKCSGFNNESKNFDHEEVMAGNLNVGDEILISQPYYLDDDTIQIVYGSILGDGSIRSVSEKCSQLRIDHGIEQDEYAKWKQEILGNLVSHIENENNGSKFNRYAFDTIPLYELNRLEYRTQNIEKCIIPKEVAENINLLGLTVWYLDDGNFSGHYKKWGNGRSYISCIKFSNREIMLPFFNSLGLYPTIQDKGFIFDSDNTKKFHSLICKYVPACMEYKLHPNYRGKYDYEINDKETNVVYKPVPAKIIDIYEKPSTKTKKKFDLTIEDNSTYLVDGAIVHNSPETTPGGLALKFYSDQRIRVQGKGKITVKEGGKDIPVGQNSEVTFVKNKTARPFGKAEFKIIFDHSALNPVVMLCNVAKGYKIIKTYGGLFNIDKDVTGKKIETGKSTIIELADYLVKENLVTTILEKVKESISEDNEAEALDEAIIEMETDPSKIVSPLDAVVDAVKVDDAKVDELGDDAKEEKPEDIED